MTSLEEGSLFQHIGLKIRGLSLSGIRTALTLPDLGLCFDVAQGYPFVLKMKKFFITHGHLDHAAGIPYLLSQKAMHNEASPPIYLPPSLIDPMTGIMRLWEQIEKHQYSLNFFPVSPDKRIEINSQHFVQPFKTVHRVESFGYTVFSTQKKLKSEFFGTPGPALSALRKKGTSVEDIVETPLISFTGDTQIEFLDQAPWIRNSKILVCEATYLDERKTTQQARDWGHTHLNELIPELDRIRSEKIVLIHSSSRYSFAQAQSILNERIPKDHQERVVLFEGR